MLTTCSEHFLDYIKEDMVREVRARTLRDMSKQFSHRWKKRIAGYGELISSCGDDGRRPFAPTDFQTGLKSGMETGCGFEAGTGYRPILPEWMDLVLHRMKEFMIFTCLACRLLP